MARIGLITYHAAYNFGSMLQAYATQNKLESMGHKVKIINYRMQSQKNFYKLYRTKYGKLNLIQDLCQLPMHNKKVLRSNNYEKFIEKYFNLTEEFAEPGKVEEITSEFEILISGSDQIWNKNSCEFVNCDRNYMLPYLLEGFEKKKISYASSIGHIEEKDLQYILPYLKKFNKISVREEKAADRLSKYLDNIYRVVDPTFLLNKKEWVECFDMKKKDVKPYILFYSLKRFDGNKILKDVIHLAQRLNLEVRYIMPFSYYPNLNKSVYNCEEYGPIEFLDAIYNAEMIITDSYHGTILSINLEKDIYSICYSGGAEYRKTEVLDRLGLGERIISSIHEITTKKQINYSKVNMVLSKEREDSIRFLTDTCDA